jgi:hypothetical protein
MAEITAAAVGKLREMTNAGLMDCKKALAEAAGDLDTAVEILRKRGVAQAAKKAGRDAREGVIAQNIAPGGTHRACSSKSTAKPISSPRTTPSRRSATTSPAPSPPIPVRRPRSPPRRGRRQDRREHPHRPPAIAST